MNAREFETRFSNLPTKDFAFYGTPDAAADRAVRYVTIKNDMRILEPSAGNGALIRAIRRKIAQTKTYRDEYEVSESRVGLDAIEIHPARCQVLRVQEGNFCSVIKGNFLDREALPIYSCAIMNPPFHGTSWMDHFKHAYDFVKSGGYVVCILPISASLGDTVRHAQFHRWLDRAGRYEWHDLPSGSFADSGTMIETTILRIFKP